MSDKMMKLLSTFFYVGYSPAAPGTMASLAGMLIALLFRNNAILYILITIIAVIIGFMSCERIEKILGKKDPSEVVIDEVAGILISGLFLPLNSWPVIITVFFLFRAFDMFKIYPVNKFEEIAGGTGIMMDDIVAGIYTNIVMQLALRLAGLL